MLKILYLVPSLSDPAVARRLAMFQLGGAAVEIAGFRRADAPPADLPAAQVIELDITHDARMLHRMLATARAGYTVQRWARSLSRPDVIVARNLEMLAVANRLLNVWSERPALAYECLDIHRLMLRNDGIGRAMRGLEQRLMESAGLLLTSSPAFLANYFDLRSAPPAHLVENKVFAPGSDLRGRNPALAEAPGALRIGWFGALRCHRSLSALAELSTKMAGRLSVTLRGRPALTEFDGFHDQIAAAPHLDYAGPYRYPGDLPEIYSQVHFAWAIDFFEQGQNSAWLLPNRLYEGCLNGAIPVALAGTETAAFLDRLGIGVVLPDIETGTLVDLFSSMTPARVEAMARAVAGLDPSRFRSDAAECAALVGALANLQGDTAGLEVAA